MPTTVRIERAATFKENAMRKLAVSLILGLTVTSAMAQHHGHWRHGGGGTWHWVAPVIVGGVIGYELARPNPPVVVQQQQPVIVQQTQNCSPWTEIRNLDGTTTITRTCQ